jgi:hypothetical protein
MKNRYPLFITILIGIHSSVACNPIISFFFKPQPDAQKMVKKLNKPGKIAKHTIDGITQHSPIAGICVTYSGYLDVSDENGQVSFPRKHTADQADIIITTAFEPVPLFEKTIQHWRLSKKANASRYLIKEVYDEKNNEYTWHTEQAPLPSDDIIPLSAIVIIAKPSHIVIPSEIHKTVKTANLTLPPVYVKKGINIVSGCAYFLEIRHLFRPVDSKVQRTPLRLTTHLLD